MPVEPTHLTALRRALREAETALGAGRTPEEVRAVLRPHESRLRDAYARFAALRTGDGGDLRPLQRENELLSRSVIRLELDVQVLLEVLAHGASPGEDGAEPQ